MRLLFFILFSASLQSPSTSFVTADPSLFDTTEDQLSVPLGDISSSNIFDPTDDQIYSTPDQWNLPQDSPSLDFSVVDASCSDHAEEADLPLIAKLRSRAPKPDDICVPEGKVDAAGSEPEWQNGNSDVQTGVVNVIPDFPLLVFPDILRHGLSPSVCDKYTAVVMFPVCDSGHPKDRSVSLIHWNPYFPMYKLDNCQICTFLR